MSLGATPEEVAASTNLGELALDLTLRPRGPLPLREVAAAAGLDWPTTLRLMTAAGLPTDPDFHVTADEAAAIRLFAGAYNNLLGEEATLQLARVTGNAMARLAETLVGVFRLQVELPRRAAGTAYVDVVKEYADLTQTLLPNFVSTLDAVLRRQIVAVAERMWSTDPERSVVTVQRTVGFVDLVGYTTRRRPCRCGSSRMSWSSSTCAPPRSSPRGNGQIVKTIGDEAMFVTEDAEDACRIALDLIDAAGWDAPCGQGRAGHRRDGLGVRRPLRPRRQPGRPAGRRGRTVDGRRVRSDPSGRRRLPVRAAPAADVEGLRGTDHGVPAGAVGRDERTALRRPLDRAIASPRRPCPWQSAPSATAAVHPRRAAWPGALDPAHGASPSSVAAADRGCLDPATGGRHGKGFHACTDDPTDARRPAPGPGPACTGSWAGGCRGPRPPGTASDPENLSGP